MSHMDAHLTSIDRFYVVPPQNIVRVVVSSASDGLHYVSVEDLRSGPRRQHWAARKGCTDVFPTRPAAMGFARQVWAELRTEVCHVR